MRRLLPKKPCHLLFCLWNNIDNEHISFSFQFFSRLEQALISIFETKISVALKRRFGNSPNNRTFDENTHTHTKKANVVDEKGVWNRTDPNVKSDMNLVHYVLQRFFFRAVIPCKQLVLLLYLILIFIVYCKKQKHTEWARERQKGYKWHRKELKRIRVSYRKLDSFSFWTQMHTDGVSRNLFLYHVENYSKKNKSCRYGHIWISSHRKKQWTWYCQGGNGMTLYCWKYNKINVFIWVWIGEKRVSQKKRYGPVREEMCWN